VRQPQPIDGLGQRQPVHGSDVARQFAAAVVITPARGGAFLGRVQLKNLPTASWQAQRLFHERFPVHQKGFHRA
jgi:hypothetical protein